jgi:hypothetical protein
MRRALVAYAVPSERLAPSGQRRTTIEIGVSPEYFRTLEIPMREGRDFDEGRETGGALEVAVVNRTPSRNGSLGSGSPLGHGRSSWSSARVPVTVIGVVDDTTSEPSSSAKRNRSSIAR